MRDGRGPGTLASAGAALVCALSAAVLVAGCAPPSPAGRVEAAFGLELEPVAGSIGWRSPEREALRGLSWIDVEGDGDLDLLEAPGVYAVEGNFNVTGRLVLRLNDGLRGFSLGQILAEDVDVGGVAWGDVDLDGDPDLAVGYAAIPVRGAFPARYVAGPVALHRNDGGVLGPGVELSGSFRFTKAVAWADIDGDGFIELLQGSEAGLSVYANDGGTLAEPELVWSAGTVHGLVLGDRDDDGLPEAVLATSVGLVFLSNDGGRLSSTAYQTLLSGRPVFAVALGDWLDDGRLHPAFVTETDVRVYRDTGAGFAERLTYARVEGAPTAVAWSDLDQDGDLDLVTGWDDGTIEVFEAFDSFTGRLLESGWTDALSEAPVSSLAPGDWDGDGDEDLAVSNGRSRQGDALTVHGVYETLETRPATVDLDYSLGTTAAAAGDVTGTGVVEVAVGLTVQDPNLGRHALVASVRLGPDGPEDPRPLFEFPPGRPSEWGPMVTDLAWGDWDGDGDLDLALAAEDGAALLRVGETTAAHWFEPGTSAASKVLFGDPDEDGDLDLTVYGDARLRHYRNDDGVFRLLQDIAPRGASGGGGIAWATPDGDGRWRLVVADRRLTILDPGAEPDDPWVERDLDFPAADLGRIAAGDVDGDGDDELLVGGIEGDRVVDVRGGRVDVLWAGAVAPGLGGGSIALDFDEDGRLDFLSESGQTVLYQRRGAGWVPTVPLPGAGLIPMDFDADGDEDLLTPGRSDSIWSVVPNPRRGGEALPENPTRIDLVSVGGERPLGAMQSSRVFRREDGPLEVVVRLFDAESDLPRGLRFEFRDWQGGWRPATVRGLSGPLAAAPHADGGVEHRGTWSWVEDGVDGETARLRAVLDYQTSLGGTVRAARTASTSSPLRFRLDSDGDGVRDAADPCPADRTDDSLVPGVCDSETLGGGLWCGLAAPLRPGAWAWLLPLLSLRRRRRALSAREEAGGAGSPPPRARSRFRPSPRRPRAGPTAAR